jgi:hypothetical protein
MTKAESTDIAGTVAEHGVTAALQKAVSKKTTSRKKRAPQARKMIPGAKSTKGKVGKKSPRRATPRPQSKGSQILELVGRVNGATLAEIMEATSWQAHSVRGFISTASKKHRVKIESSKNEDGGRVYRIAN